MVHGGLRSEQTLGFIIKIDQPNIICLRRQSDPFQMVEIIVSFQWNERLVWNTNGSLVEMDEFRGKWETEYGSARMLLVTHTNDEERTVRGSVLELVCQNFEDLWVLRSFPGLLNSIVNIDRHKNWHGTYLNPICAGFYVQLEFVEAAPVYEQFDEFHLVEVSVTVSHEIMKASTASICGGVLQHKAEFRPTKAQGFESFFHDALQFGVGDNAKIIRCASINTKSQAD
jgi:hypothetical protein